MPSFSGPGFYGLRLFRVTRCVWQAAAHERAVLELGSKSSRTLVLGVPGAY